jgi:glyoxylase I family protein
MKLISRIHHVAIICSNYEISKTFYTQILGFKVENEVYRQERDSYKLDLSLNGLYTLELFSFPKTPERLSQPEATGLRHIAFEVENIDFTLNHLSKQNIPFEPLRIDDYSLKKFTFIFDPDNLPIELYER